jgi:hypothetical protein
MALPYILMTRHQHTFSFLCVYLLSIYISESMYVRMCVATRHWCFFWVRPVAVINKIKYITCCYAADNNEVVFSFGSVLELL